MVQQHSIAAHDAGSPARPLTLPARIKLESLADDRLRVKEPIAVAVFRDDEGFILAEAVELNEFGYGDDPAAAVQELRYAIADLYFSLEEDQDRLGPGLQTVWAVLQAKIEKG